ncbi:hypothetical protein BDN71DRAFT_1399262, partial [Pleurotus eryngii]
TRIAPSNTFDDLNENFNNGQLVFTVTGLNGAIVITRPMERQTSTRAMISVNGQKQGYIIYIMIRGYVHGTSRWIILT